MTALTVKPRTATPVGTPDLHVVSERLGFYRSPDEPDPQRVRHLPDLMGQATIERCPLASTPDPLVRTAIRSKFITMDRMIARFIFVQHRREVRNVLGEAHHRPIARSAAGQSKAYQRSDLHWVQGQQSSARTRQSCSFSGMPRQPSFFQPLAGTHCNLRYRSQ